MSNKIFDKYSDPSFPGSFAGVDKFYRALKEKEPKTRRKEVVDSLALHETYTLHRPVRKHFERTPVIVASVDDTWSIDLIDMIQQQRQNRSFRYILTVIDILSKFAWTAVLKKKDKNSVTRAFKSILDSTTRRPQRIHADKGLEFYNSEFKKLLEQHSIKMYSTFSGLKAVVVERFNRTLRERLGRIFTKNGNGRYVDILDNVVDSYNHTYHRSIKMQPAEVTKKNQQEVWDTLYGYDFDEDLEKQGQKKLKFKIGDLVRITNKKTLFEKSATEIWSKEVFIIVKVIELQRMVYEIKDLESASVEGVFYQEQLQHVSRKLYPDGIFMINSILDTRTVNNKVEKLVSYVGRPETEWVTEDQLIQK